MRLTRGTDFPRARWALVVAIVGLSACGPRPLTDDLVAGTGGGGGAPGTIGTVTDAGRANDAARGQCSTTNAPPGPFAFLSAGNEGSCGIRTDGTLACWGETYWYTLPDPFPGTYTHVSRLGGVCAVQTSGALSCWASSDNNLVAAPAGAFAEVAIGEPAACARRADGSVACWGSGANVPPGYTFESLTGGAYSFCGLETAGHAIVCWDPRYQGEMVHIEIGPFVAVDTGRFFACGLRPDGSVSCWSASFPPGFSDSNTYGQLSPPPGPFVELSVGEMHACGRRADGHVECWGADSYGQSTPPVGVRFTHVSAGSSHTCGVLPDGNAVCWGGSCNPWG
jgi:hypothetical protein